MLFAEAVYIGVDPAAGRRPIAYAALEADLQPVALDAGDLEEVVAFIAGQAAAVVAIDAPHSTARGLLAQPEIRRRYNLRPGGRTWAAWRLCDFEMRRRGLPVSGGGSMSRLAPGWVEQGRRLFERLRGLGFRFFRKGEEPDRRTLLEVQAQAAFGALLGRRPFPKGTLEGRLQRQLVLYLEGLDIPNPMRALEEITRHRLLTGDLPLETLCEPGALDALVAAYTACLAATRPSRVCQVGDPEEGLVTLPVAELQDHYA